VPSCRSPRCNWTKRDEEGFSQSKQGEGDWSRDELTCKINILERKKVKKFKKFKKFEIQEIQEIQSV
jgi:hypothetical protein